MHGAMHECLKYLLAVAVSPRLALVLSLVCSARSSHLYCIRVALRKRDIVQGHWGCSARLRVPRCLPPCLPVA